MLRYALGNPCAPGPKIPSKMIYIAYDLIKTRGPGPRLMHPRAPGPQKITKKNFKNGVLGRFWADLDCRFEFYVKNYVG